MVRKVYIGRPSAHLGRTAFQLLANLKNFGVGRMLTRHEFDRWPEPSYHVVKRVQTYMDPELKFGTLWCETVVRGKRLPGVRPLRVTYRPDFRLIPKDEEAEFVGQHPIEDLGQNPNVLPREYPVPPLMRLWMKRHFSQHNADVPTDAKQFLIPFVYQDAKDARQPDADLFWVANRLANEGEKPNVEFDGRFHFSQDYLKNCTESA